jgi:hypothetical protein
MILEARYFSHGTGYFLPELRQMYAEPPRTLRDLQPFAQALGKSVNLLGSGQRDYVMFAQEKGIS